MIISIDLLTLMELSQEAQCNRILANPLRQSELFHHHGGILWHWSRAQTQRPPCEQPPPQPLLPITSPASLSCSVPPARSANPSNPGHFPGMPAECYQPRSGMLGSRLCLASARGTPEYVLAERPLPQCNRQTNTRRKKRPSSFCRAAAASRRGRHAAAKVSASHAATLR